MFGYGMAASYIQVTLGSYMERSSVTRGGVLAAGLALFLSANYFAYLQDGTDWMSSPDFVFIVSFPCLVCSGVGLMLLAVVCTGGNGGILAWRPIVMVGTVSYSLYLYHILIQVALFPFVNLSSSISNFYVRGFVYGLIFLIPTLLFSTAAYLLVEKPSLRWAKSFRGS